MITAILIFLSLSWPPLLPDDKKVDTASSASLLVPRETLREGVKIAAKAPIVDFLYYDCQVYEPTDGGIWSHWGDGLAQGPLYYSSVGDHMSPCGNAFLYAYDSVKKEMTQLMDLRSILNQLEGCYTPGKIHSQINLGSDGWLYFSTHRGSTRIASHPTAQFVGDWIIRHHPGKNQSEVVAHAPLEMQSLPTGQIDPERLIFYAGTADGFREREPQFLAYDLKHGKVLARNDRGPHRAMIFSRSTGCVYFHTEKSGSAPLIKFDPSKPDLFSPLPTELGLRCATLENDQGKVYTIDGDEMWQFDVATETSRSLGPVTVGSESYITSLDFDPARQRYLYYVPGSHGGAYRDGSPLVQYDLETGTRKVICFLADHCKEHYGFIPMGSYSSAVSPDGTKVYITWMGNRGADDAPGSGEIKLKFNTNALTVVHIPEEERP